MRRSGLLVLVVVACLVVFCLATCLASGAPTTPWGRRHVRVNSLAAGKHAASMTMSKNYQKRNEERLAQSKRSKTDIFSVIPGRYPKTKSLPDVLTEIPNTPEGRKFIHELANYIYTSFGIWVPDFIVDLFFEDATALLDYLVFTGWELYDGIFALNYAYWNGWISFTPPYRDYLPLGFDLAQTQQFPLNISNYMPGPPVQIAPNLWKGFYPGNVSEETTKAEIVFSLALNQLANNSHLADTDPNQFFVIYNGQKITSIKDLLGSLMANGHEIKSFLTWRVADFFGFLTKNEKGEWLEVPTPVMMDTEVRDPVTGKRAILPAIHDEIVLQIRSGPNTKGTKFDIDILWYEGDDGIGFFARDLYDLSSWVGKVETEFMEGQQAVDYIHLAGVFSDVLIQSAKKFNLYDLGYGATGVCVDSVAVAEYTVYHNMTLYPLLMEKSVVVPVVTEYLGLNNKNAADYKNLLAGLDYLRTDNLPNPTLKQRALNTITWPEGKEPFQTVVDARKILSQ